MGQHSFSLMQWRAAIGNVDAEGFVVGKVDGDDKASCMLLHCMQLDKVDLPRVSL